MPAYAHQEVTFVPLELVPAGLIALVGLAGVFLAGYLCRSVAVRVLRRQIEEKRRRIEEYQQLTEELEASRLRYQSLVEASAQIVWRTDPTGQALEITGIEFDRGLDGSSADLDRDWYARVHPEDASLLKGEWEHAVREGSPFSCEFRFQRGPGGEYRHHHARGIPMRDAGGSIVEWLGTCTDIHDRREAEARLLQAQKMEALNTLAGGIAHDFNNILSALAGNIRLALDLVPAGHEAKHPLRQAERSAQRASGLVQQMLTFSRQTGAKAAPIEMHRCLDAVTQLMRPSVPAHITLESTCDHPLPRIVGDENQIEQALMNLIINAIQALGEKSGTIRLEARTDGAQLLVTVADDGPGISVADQKRVFEPFFTTKPTGQGTGLGLSVVHGVMEAHGGTVRLESEAGTGTRFHLRFPVAEQKIAVSPPPIQGTGGGQRILYVDDDRSLVDLTRRVLGRKGYKVTGVESGEVAIDLFRQHPDGFDVVVTDLTMPGMSGFDLSRQILEIRPGFPVVLMSGYIRLEDEANAESIGIRKVLGKQLTDDELMAALEEIFAPIAA